MIRDLETFSTLDKVVYQTMHSTFRCLGKLIAGLEISGAENIPMEGGVILSSNHRHWIDIFMVPFSADRHVSMVAKKETRDTPIMGTLFEHCNAIFIGRGQDFTRDEQRIIEERVAEGGVVGYFSEGTRGDTQRHRDSPYTLNLGVIQEGIALTAARTEVPTIPVAISGFDFLFSRGHQRTGRVNIGKPMEAPNKSLSSREAYKNELARRTAELYAQTMKDRGIDTARHNGSHHL